MAPPRSFIWTRRIVLTVLTIFALLPLYVMVSSSLKPLQDVTGTFRWIPSPITFSSYIQMWQTVPLAQYFVNSLIVCTCAAALSVLVATFAAYAVSRYRFRGRRVFTLVVLSTQMFPGILFLLPLFLIFVLDRERDRDYAARLADRANHHLPDVLAAVLHLAAGRLLRLDSARPRRSGMGRWLRTASRVVPRGDPGGHPRHITVAIYAFMTAWGEVLFASVMTNDTTRTLAVGLRDYSTQNDVYWNQIMAASIVVSIPVVAGFLLMQRFLVTGLTAGSVK